MQAAPGTPGALPKPMYEPQLVLGGSAAPPAPSRSAGRSALLFFVARHSPEQLRQYAGLALGGGLLCALLLPTTPGVVLLVLSMCCAGYLFAAYLCNDVLALDDGSREMREVSEPIREGAEGFLKVQYTAVSRLAVPLAGLIFVSYLFRPSSALSAHVSNFSSGVVAALSFLAGCVCSAASGYSAMWVASLTNIRVAAAARRSYGEALVVCFRGGAFSAVLNIALCVTGVTALFVTLAAFYVGAGGLKLTDVPMVRDPRSEASERETSAGRQRRANGRFPPAFGRSERRKRARAAAPSFALVRASETSYFSRLFGSSAPTTSSSHLYAPFARLASLAALTLPPPPHTHPSSWWGTASGRPSWRCSCSWAAASTPRPPTWAPTWWARWSAASRRTTRATPR
jgi:hypothetical protein